MKSKYRISIFLIIIVTLGSSLGSVAQTKELPNIVILATEEPSLERQLQELRQATPQGQ